MKLLSKLAIAFVICLLAIPVLGPISPVQATSASFSISHGSIARDEGYVGDEVRISGSWDDTYGAHIYIYYELYNVDEDHWDYEKARYSNYDTTNAFYSFYSSFTIPESCAGEHDILICYYDDPDDVADTLQFTIHPSIEIDETEGPAGTEVKVSGKGWAENESEIEIRFYLQDPGTTHYETSSYYEVVATVEIDVDDYGTWEDEIAFNVPPASKGDHWIYAVGSKTETNDIEDDNIKGVEFEILPGISVSPASGAPGEVITVTGSGFAADEEDIEILFDNDMVASNIKADNDGVWGKTVTVPQLPKDTYDISAEGEYTAAEDLTEVEFEVVPGLTVTPIEGHVGTTVNLSGGGFPAGKTISATYDGVQVGTTTTDANGSFANFTFEATNKQTTHVVNHPIVVTYDSATLSNNFVMESVPPPIPMPVAPGNGSRIGYVGKQKPTLEWSAVTDDSGVTYDLQVSSTEDFAEILVSTTDLTEATYTLSDEAGLSYGTYYWRVKAIDGARNDSGWCSPYHFKTDLLPFWAAIAIVALLVVLIGFLVYFFAVRRRSFYD